MIKKILASVGVAAIAASAAVVPASAAETSYLSANPVPMPAINANLGYTWKMDAVELNYRNMQPGTLLFASICRRPQTDPNFGSWGESCSALSEIMVQPSFVGAGGNGTVTMPIFRGENPDGDATWGCFAPEDTPNEGVEKLTTCYIRLASNMETDTTYSHTIPFTIANAVSPGESTTTTTTTPTGGEDPEPVIPEAGTVIALPIVAGGIAAVAVAAQRRRKAISA